VTSISQGCSFAEGGEIIAPSLVPLVNAGAMESAHLRAVGGAAYGREATLRVKDIDIGHANRAADAARCGHGQP
jgi:hypothetical protein